jgi:hypothetical protein
MESSGYKTAAPYRSVVGRFCSRANTSPPTEYRLVRVGGVDETRIQNGRVVAARPTEAKGWLKYQCEQPPFARCRMTVSGTERQRAVSEKTGSGSETAGRRRCRVGRLWCRRLHRGGRPGVGRSTSVSRFG